MFGAFYFLIRVFCVIVSIFSLAFTILTFLQNVAATRVAVYPWFTCTSSLQASTYLRHRTIIILVTHPLPTSCYVQRVIIDVIITYILHCSLTKSSILSCVFVSDHYLVLGLWLEPVFWQSISVALIIVSVSAVVLATSVPSSPHCVSFTSLFEINWRFKSIKVLVSVERPVMSTPYLRYILASPKHSHGTVLV